MSDDAPPAAAPTGPDAAATAARPATDAAGRRFLGEVLIDKALLTRTQLDDALLKQRVSGKRLGTLLVELGLLDERDLATALGEHFGVAVIDLRRRAPDPEAVSQLLSRSPARWCRCRWRSSTGSSRSRSPTPATS